MLSGVILFFEILGTASFAVSGAMTGIRKNMDMIGVLILGIVTATGGGVIRDLVLGNTPPDAFVHPIYAVVAALCVLPTYFHIWRNMVDRNHRLYDLVMLLTDSAGLGLFTMMGIRTAYLKIEDPGIFLLIFVGVITGTGGGILRDLLAGMTPYIFSKQFYLTASLIGALVCMLIWEVGPDTVTWHYIAMGTGAVIIFILRLFAAHFRWDLPRPWAEGSKK